MPATRRDARRILRPANQALRQTLPKLACPTCGEWTNRVVPTALKQTLEGYRRYRSCQACGVVFETVESVTRVVRESEQKSA